MTPYFDRDGITLYHGDCLEILPTLAGVDVVVTDPPYGKKFHDGGISGRSSERWAMPSPAKFRGVSIRNDSRPDVSALPFIATAIKLGGACYLCSQWMTESAWIDGLRANGLTVRNRLIWAKPFHGAGDLKTTFGPQHESILFATKGRHELRGRRDGDIWTEPVGSNGCFRKGNEHPNQKPVALMAWLLGKSTAAGGCVLDPYMGSGSTGVACIRTGRKFVGIELDERYCEIAAKRIETELARTALFA